MNPQSNKVHFTLTNVGSVTNSFVMTKKFFFELFEQWKRRMVLKHGA